jgi:hypothetical protein
VEVMMHNLIPFNQLAAWNDNVQHLGETLDEFNEQGNIINDYYQCLIECDENQQVCKRICKEVLIS